uniref:Uncharacterized protein n=1 Tax=Physcomitrium patens TaxID=3218 RepID=A0A2K1K9Q9_PHYPA|nr:hypothetical protein PHYPA_009700 [Physcomitrium patens]
MLENGLKSLFWLEQRRKIFRFQISRSFNEKSGDFNKEGSVLTLNFKSGICLQARLAPPSCFLLRS